MALTDILKRPGKKAAAIEPETPPKPPTMLEQAQQAFKAAEQALATVKQRRQELSSLIDNLPPIDPSIPIDQRMELELKHATAKNLRESLEKDLTEAQAVFNRRQSELASASVRAENAAKVLRYREKRVSPLLRQEEALRAAHAALRPLMEPDAQRDLENYAGIIAHASSTITTLLTYTLPELKREFDAAQADAERIGVLD